MLDTKPAILSSNSNIVLANRYAFQEGETWEQLSNRVATVGAEPEQDKSKYHDLFSNIIGSQAFIPAGRILRNCGRAKGSLFNCYALGVGDSINEIGHFIADCLTLWSEGGGVGCNFSTLRPKGANIIGKGGKSSGLVSFMKAADAVAGTVESGGQRRAAALGLCEVSHPEIIDFIDAKMVSGALSCFNISVGVTNDFIDAVESDALWEFKFQNQSYGTIPAREIWQKIIFNMHKSAEPGLINMTNLRSNNSWYYDPIVSTNPCGEVPLGKNNVCNLGSLVLPNFVTNINTNWKKLEEVIHLGVRFLDNIIDMNNYALKAIDLKAHESRRIGLGILGLGDYLMAKKIRYGSEKGVQETERLMRFIRDATYEASIKLSVEKGSFPKFDSFYYCKSHFIRTLPASIRMDIKKYGTRNATLLSVAPNGTTGLLCDCSGGVEPLFSKAYKRVDNISERIYIHPKYEEILLKGEGTPDWFVDTYDLSPQQHLEMQVAVQKYIDCSVSKTINLPNSATVEDLDVILLEYIKDLKGITVYRDGCRDGQPLNKITETEAIEYLRTEGKIIDHNLTQDDVKCHNGKCDL